MRFRFSTATLGLTLALCSNGLAACNPIEEKACSYGSYPVKRTDGDGSACVKKGETHSFRFHHV